MKDMYSFDKTKEEALLTYNELIGAYKRVFEALELPVVIAAADSGLIGGDTTHEFHVLSPMGEDVLLCCNKCDYVANVEKAKSYPQPIVVKAEQNEVGSVLRSAIQIARDVSTLAQVGKPMLLRLNFNSLYPRP